MATIWTWPRRTWLAWKRGVKARAATSAKVASVASFFVSRIDTQIDNAVEAKIKDGDAASAELKGLAGQGRHRQRQGRL